MVSTNGMVLHPFICPCWHMTRCIVLLKDPGSVSEMLCNDSPQNVIQNWNVFLSVDIPINARCSCSHSNLIGSTCTVHSHLTDVLAPCLRTKFTLVAYFYCFLSGSLFWIAISTVKSTCWHRHRFHFANSLMSSQLHMYIIGFLICFHIDILYVLTDFTLQIYK